MITQVHWRTRLDRLISSPGLVFDQSLSTNLGNADLVSRATSWGIIGGFFYRITLGPTLFADTLANAQNPGKLLVAIVVVLSGDLALLVGLLAGRLGWLLRSRVFFAVDVLITVVLNLWAATAIQPGTLFMPAHDVLWGYAFGTLALWTVARGPRTGALLLAGGAALHLVMAWLNHAVLNPHAWMEYLYRSTLLAAAFALPVFFVAIARQNARLAVAEALRAGRAEERAEMLRTMHDTVLQTLGTIVLRASGGTQPVEERMRDVRVVALQQHQELRKMLAQDDERILGGLASQLAVLVQEFLVRGLNVELVATELATDPPAAIARALVGAVREALANVRKHAGVERAVVRVTSSPEGVEVVVRDQGRGFDSSASTAGYGLKNSIRQRVEAVGGHVQVWSAPGQGARVRLWWTTL